MPDASIAETTAGSIKKIVLADPVSGEPYKASGGASSGGDASAANQLTEIARLEAIRDRLPSSLVSSALAARDQNGTGAVRYTTDTTAVTGTTFGQIMCLTETEFSTLTRTNATGSLTGVTLPAGTLLIGPFTSYTLASGVVAAYV